MEDNCNLSPFLIIIFLELIFVQIVGLGRLFLSVAKSEEQHPGRDCDTGSESRLEQHPPLDTPTDPQFPLVRKTGTWVAADSGASPATPSVQATLPLQPATATSSSPRSSSDSAPSLTATHSPMSSLTSSPATSSPMSSLTSLPASPSPMSSLTSSPMSRSSFSSAALISSRPSRASTTASPSPRAIASSSATSSSPSPRSAMSSSSFLTPLLSLEQSTSGCWSTMRGSATLTPGLTTCWWPSCSSSSARDSGTSAPSSFRSGPRSG